MDRQEQAWWHNQDLSGLTDLERKIIVLRYDIEDAGTHTLEQVGQAVSHTAAHVFNLIKRAHVRVDRESLVADGVAMQLTHDEPLRGLQIRTSGGRKGPAILALLADYHILTYNQLLDKSSRWLTWGGVNWATTRNIAEALARERLFLRGSVPDSAHDRTRAAHTLTAD